MKILKVSFILILIITIVEIVYFFLLTRNNNMSQTVTLPNQLSSQNQTTCDCTERSDAVKEIDHKRTEIDKQYESLLTSGMLENISKIKKTPNTSAFMYIVKIGKISKISRYDNGTKVKITITDNDDKYIDDIFINLVTNPEPFYKLITGAQKKLTIDELVIGDKITYTLKLDLLTNDAIPDYKIN
jgi:hypothetical protein